MRRSTGCCLHRFPADALYLGKYLANLSSCCWSKRSRCRSFVLFFNVDIGQALPGLVGTMLLATAGFVAVGTVFSAMVVTHPVRGADAADAAAAVHGAAAHLRGEDSRCRLFAGRPLSEVVGWLRFLAVYDVVF